MKKDNEYIITKIEKYNIEKDNSKRGIKFYSFMTAAFALMFIGYNIAHNNNINNSIKFGLYEYFVLHWRHIVFIAGTSSFFISLKNVLENFALSNRIDELEALLQELYCQDDQELKERNTKSK